MTLRPFGPVPPQRTCAWTSSSRRRHTVGYSGHVVVAASTAVGRAAAVVFTITGSVLLLQPVQDRVDRLLPAGVQHQVVAHAGEQQRRAAVAAGDPGERGTRDDPVVRAADDEHLRLADLLL